MSRRIAAVVLLALLALTGAAMADNLQFVPVNVQFLGNGTTGSNFSLPSPPSSIVVAFGSVPTTDTAVGDTVTIGSGNIAFFSSGGGGVGALNGTQNITIGGVSTVGGLYAATLQSIFLTTSGPGSFALNIAVGPGTFTAGTGTASQNLQELAAGGSAVLTFQIAGGPGLSALIASNANFQSSGSGSITAVPEPASMMLFGSGLVGLAGVLKRKLGK